MSVRHLTEEEVQRLALGMEEAAPALQLHLQSCSSCRKAVDDYVALFAAITKQEPARFDFDLLELVMPEIQQQQPRLLARLFRVLMITALASLVMIPLYLFRKMFLQLMVGVSAVFLWLSILAFVLIIVYNILHLYQNYQKQVKKLDFLD